MGKDRKKICYFGIYDPNYSRNRILIRGLKENNIEVIECNKKGRSLKNYWLLYKKHRGLKDKYDLMLVGFPGQRVIWLAKLICQKKIIFDAFISQYDTYVFDRKVCFPISFTALGLWLLDWYSLKLADIILTDTNKHIKYFVNTFKIKANKFIRIFVGSDDRVIYPIDNNFKPRREFVVHFHGNYIPLQGTQYIIKAANLLKEERDISFNLIGEGSEYKKIEKLVRDLELTNVQLIKPVAYKELSFWMAKSDVCLGIFGNTPKAKRVIPNKVFEALAAQRAVITGDTPAIRELLEDQKNCLLCKVADGQDLALKILELKNNPKLKENIAENGYQLFKTKLTPKILVGKLIDSLHL